MSNTVYPEALDAFATAQVDYLGDTVKAQLLSSTYTYSSAHDVLDDVDSGALISTPETLAGKSVAAGEFFADDVVFPSVALGDTVSAILIYQDTGSSSTSRLLAYIDHRSDTVPISIVTNGEDITCAWPDNRIFRI